MGVRAKSPQLRPTLRNSMDWTLPGSSVPGILQARMLEWTDVPPSRGASPPRDSVSLVSCIGRWLLYQ